MKKSILLLFCLSMTLSLLFSCALPIGSFQTGNGEENNFSGENGNNTSNSEREEKDEYTVTFDAMDGSLPTTKVVKAGSTLYTPYYIPAKPDYVFDCWCLGDKVWRFGTDKVTEDITLTAKFKTLDYTINYEFNGGRCDEELPAIYNIETEDYALPLAYKDGYVFDGWYLNGEKITTVKKEIKSNLTLSAKFYSSLPEIIESSNDVQCQRLIATEVDDTVTVEMATKEKKASLFKIRVKVPERWLYLSVSQGSNRRYAQTEEIGNETYATLDMTSDSYSAILTPITYKGDTTLESSFGTTLPSGKVIDVNYFPGFVRKAVTFTIDDGLVNFDEHLLSILRPAGIKGTLNLCNATSLTPEEYRKLYEGYEIANHHILHTTGYKSDFDYSKIEFIDGFLPAEAEQNKSAIYKNGAKVDGQLVDGFYYVHYSIYGSTAGWHPLATDETYIKYLKITEEKLEAVFGEGSIVGFAYPHGNVPLGPKNYLSGEESGYLYARKTGNLKDTTGFALPSDRFAWTYNADHSCLLSVMADFDAYRDDGELKMFSFGVHAKDFETYDKWGDLETFAKLYGNRPEDFWYATNREIFEYEDAIKALIISEEGITNNSNIDVFVTIDGVKTLIPAGITHVFEN